MGLVVVDGVGHIPVSWYNKASQTALGNTVHFQDLRFYFISWFYGYSGERYPDSWWPASK